MNDEFDDDLDRLAREAQSHGDAQYRGEPEPGMSKLQIAVLVLVATTICLVGAYYALDAAGRHIAATAIEMMNHG